MPEPQAGPVVFFTADHRDCDGLWADLEAAIDAGRTDLADDFTTFRSRMVSHLAMEEEVLFPAFEQATGMTGGGPTFVMRHEHDQQRAVLDRMAALASQGDWEGVLDEGDTLHMLVQQHNAKEEGMLYPMALRALGAEWDGLAEKVQAVRTR